MGRVRRNVIANFAGQIWTALIGIGFVPVYIRWMGIEAFGLVGLFLTLQAAAALFDPGLAGTLNRELARGAGADAGRDRRLLRTLEILYWPIGGLLGASLASAAPWIASAWLHPVSLDTRQTVDALRLMALALACQWPSLLYSSGLNGLQHQVAGNLLAGAFATVRGAGVLLPMWTIGPTLNVFFAWMACAALAQSAVQAWLLWRLLPSAAATPRFDWALMKSVGRFSAGITGIGALSFLLLQADRLILSRLLPLDRFGIYALAATVALMFSKSSQPWFAAVYPRLSQLHASHDPRSLGEAYHGACQWVALTVLPASVALAIYAEPLLMLWSRNPSLAAAAAPVFSVLIVGYALNGLMTMPYALQLAVGWTRLAFFTNAISVCLLVPSIIWLNERFGMIGAATAWPLLNAGYLLIAVPLMHRKILPHDLRRWYLSDVGPALLVNGALAAAALALPAAAASPTGLARVLAVYAVLLGGTLLVLPHPRLAVTRLLRARFAPGSR
jgi:O-antigen/teichoic acid export membrane protein